MHTQKNTVTEYESDLHSNGHYSHSSENEVWKGLCLIFTNA